MAKYRLRDPEVLPPFIPRTEGETPEEFAKRQKETEKITDFKEVVKSIDSSKRNFVYGGGGSESSTIVTSPPPEIKKVEEVKPILIQETKSDDLKRFRRIERRDTETQFFQGLTARPEEGLIIPKREGGSFFQPPEAFGEYRETGTTALPPPEPRFKKTSQMLIIGKPPEIKKESFEAKLEKELSKQRKPIARATEETEALPIPKKAFVSSELVVEPAKLLPKQEVGIALREKKVITAGAIVSGQVLRGVEASIEGTYQAVANPGKTIEAASTLPGKAPEIIIAGKKTITERPFFALGFVGSEVLQAKAFGNLTGITEKIRTRISPKYKPVEKGILKVDDLDIRVTRKGVKDLEVPLRQQVRFAGRQVDAISAARDLFLRKKEVIIKKPKPSPKAPPLEEAFFFSPTPTLRIRRLGIQKRATLKDIAKLKFTFKKVRPEAILLRDKVAKFPKELRGIEKKLRTGKKLSPFEEAKLLEFQLTPTGQLKPVGFLSREPEVILAPDEILRKVDVPAVTIIEGRRVPIIETKIVKATPKTRKLLEAQRKGVLQPLQQDELLKRLGKETGLDVSSYVTPSKPYLSPAFVSYPAVSFAKVSSAIPYQKPKVSKISPINISKISKAQKVKVSKYSPVKLKKMYYPSKAVYGKSTITEVPKIHPPSPPPREEPFTRIVPVPFGLPDIRTRRKKLKRKFRGYEDIAITEGFISRQLGLGGFAVTEKQVRQIARLNGFGLRRAPILKRRRKRK